MIDDLCHRKLRDITDFEWQRFIRPYLTTADSSQSEAPPSDQASEGAPETSVAEGVGSTVMLQCLDRQIEYGYEYLGCSSLPVLTARANNYIIAFTQVSWQNLKLSYLCSNGLIYGMYTVVVTHSLDRKRVLIHFQNMNSA